MLRPLFFTDEQIQAMEIQEISVNNIPSKTYKIDIASGEILASFVDYSDAIRQSVIKAILTARERYIIYSSNYGSEIYNILGKGYSQEYLELEIPRLINETLMVDDRIIGTNTYTIERKGSDIYISFTVETNVTDNVLVEVVI